MDLKMIAIAVLFIILISIQYSLNRILFELKEIKKNLYRKRNYD